MTTTSTLSLPNLANLIKSVTFKPQDLQFLINQILPEFFIKFNQKIFKQSKNYNLKKILYKEIQLLVSLLKIKAWEDVNLNSSIKFFNLLQVLSEKFYCQNFQQKQENLPERWATELYDLNVVFSDRSDNSSYIKFINSNISPGILAANKNENIIGDVYLFLTCGQSQIDLDSDHFICEPFQISTTKCLANGIAEVHQTCSNCFLSNSLNLLKVRPNPYQKLPGVVSTLPPVEDHETNQTVTDASNFDLNLELNTKNIILAVIIGASSIILIILACVCICQKNKNHHKDKNQKSNSKNSLNLNHSHEENLWLKTSSNEITQPININTETLVNNNTITTPISTQSNSQESGNSAGSQNSSEIRSVSKSNQISGGSRPDSHHLTSQQTNEILDHEVASILKQPNYTSTVNPVMPLHHGHHNNTSFNILNYSKNSGAIDARHEFSFTHATLHHNLILPTSSSHAPSTQMQHSHSTHKPNISSHPQNQSQNSNQNPNYQHPSQTLQNSKMVYTFEKDKNQNFSSNGIPKINLSEGDIMIVNGETQQV